MSDFSPNAADAVAINTLRFLAVDMVEAAKSGHPGAPMGQAAMAYVLWSRHLTADPSQPRWLNRDRFVLSCGHASALLYGLLHLSGYDLPLEQLKRFRQLHSMTAGHPEYGLAPGIETTTGPLGQGLATAVGMAMAERLLAQQFNRDGFTLFDHRIWVLASDGDMMEGVASEAASLAGNLGLGKLCVLYDANQITIDGPTSLSFSEDVPARFRALGWRTANVDDGNDLEAVDAAIREARSSEGAPMLIQVRTHIGYGAPTKQDTAASHGSPLGADEARATKEALGWPLEPTFHVPTEARAAFAPLATRGTAARESWDSLLRGYAESFPSEAAQLERRRNGELPADLFSDLPRFPVDAKGMETRKSSGAALNHFAAKLEELVGGSADLTGSNVTQIKGEADYSAGLPARNIRFGVREHAMAAALNGMALSGLLRPYGGTFLIFSDYMRPAIRLAALMGQPVVYVLTHDSIFLGEDGPTHQPVAHLAALRAIPNLDVLRPGDANETVAAWACALEQRRGPTALALSRQSVPTLEGTADLAREGVRRGGYVLHEGSASPDLILIASGSELHLIDQAAAALHDEGVAVRVVSLPSWQRFAAQEQSYRDAVLPPACRRRLAVEAGSPFGWERWVTDAGSILGIDRFGASAPAKDLAEEYGFTVGNVVARARLLLTA